MLPKLLIKNKHFMIASECNPLSLTTFCWRRCLFNTRISTLPKPSWQSPTGVQKRSPNEAKSAESAQLADYARLHWDDRVTCNDPLVNSCMITSIVAFCGTHS
ncbi:unnamed protein product [Anisakis simplex]|uniref:Uncharacterized protein n=1 Tax=Anisakis simplex TaxID=6269 RepID=A0A0M3J9E9_ANISI|nr:unnamed protein product [Anisakis simplex]